MNLTEEMFNKLTEEEINYLNSFVDENYVRKEDIWEIWKNYSTPDGNGYRELGFRQADGFFKDLFKLLK